MADNTFAGNTPANYERYMVPMIFVPYAEDVARRIAQLNPKDVLEIAAGTGVVTRAMAAVLGPDARIIATDLSQPMLDTAIARGGVDDRVSWKQADGLALPFGDSLFDVVVCQFGVMFFPDKVKGFRQARRVLRPDGRYIFAVWDRIETNEFVSVLGAKLTELFPDDPPRFMERTPHGYCDFEKISADVTAAGFSSVEFETVDHLSRAASALDAAIGYCIGSPLSGEIEARAPGRLREITEKAAEALEKHFGSGPIEGKIRAHFVTAIP